MRMSTKTLLLRLAGFAFICFAFLYGLHKYHIVAGMLLCIIAFVTIAVINSIGRKPDPVRQVVPREIQLIKLAMPYDKTYSSELSCTIAGIFYRRPRAKELVRQLVPGDILYLELEPNNLDDPFAVKIIRDGDHVGYIPKSLAEVISTNISKGVFYRAIVILNEWTYNERFNDYQSIVEVKLYPKLKTK